MHGALPLEMTIIVKSPEEIKIHQGCVLRNIVIVEIVKCFSSYTQELRYLGNLLPLQNTSTNLEL